MTTDLVFRFVDVLCPEHRVAVADSLIWPWVDSCVDIIRGECRDCAAAYDKIAVALGPGRTGCIEQFPHLLDRAAVWTSHEAGHAVADLVHGMSVIEANVTPIIGVAGRPDYDAMVIARRPISVPDDAYAITLMAGAASAEHYLATVPGHRINQADRVDIAAQTRGDQSTVRELGIDPACAIDQARRLVVAHWDIIAAVSRQLRTHHTITGPELEALVGALPAVPHHQIEVEEVQP